MRTETKFGRNRVLLGMWLLVLAWLCIGATRARGQTANAGDNAIICSGSTCSSTTMPSPAFIDASVFNNGGSDVCLQIRSVFAKLSPGTAGVVIDARGVTPASTSPAVTFNCARGTPWLDPITGPITTR
jgi:hypothetical protein